MGLINREEPPYYGADTLVSMPQAPKDDILVSMYGFGYTKFGICFDVTEAEVMELSVPRYRPDDPNLPQIRGDDDVNG